MHSGLGLDAAQTHGEPNTKYFNSKQNGGGGDVLAKGTPDVSGFNGGGGVGGVNGNQSLSLFKTPNHNILF